MCTSIFKVNFERKMQTLQFLGEHYIQFLQWPQNSLELCYIETWDYISRKTLYKQDPTSITEWQVIVMDLWNIMSHDLLFFIGTPRRLQICITSNVKRFQKIFIN